MRSKVVSLAPRDRRRETLRLREGPSWQVRIPDPHAPERTLGCGILVGARHVLTTTRAVARARGMPEGTPEVGSGELTVEFPLVPGDASIRAVVTLWLSETSGGPGIAVLALLQPPPPDARIARFAAVPPNACADRAVDYFGFGKTSLIGRHLRAYCAPGPSAASNHAELVPEGPFPEVRLDGAGVWDPLGEAVLGMIDASDAALRVDDHLLMIPTEAIARAYAGLVVLPASGYRSRIARGISSFDTRLGNRLLQVTAALALGTVGWLWWLEPEVEIHRPSTVTQDSDRNRSRAVIGLLTDDLGVPINDARVMVPALSLETTPDPAGRFLLRLPAHRSGPHEIIVVAPGFPVVSRHLATGQDHLSVQLTAPPQRRTK